MVSRKKKTPTQNNDELSEETPSKKVRAAALGDPGTSGSSKPSKQSHSSKREKNPPKRNVHEDEDDDDESVDLDIDEIMDGTKKSLKKPTKILPEVDWSEPDLFELISRIENAIPPKDNLKLESRVQKLNWDEISFGDHSAAQCREVWNNIQLRLRRYRLLREVLDDAKEWVSKPWTNFYRSSRGNRHPDLPKRPLSTYMIFYLEKKDKVAKEHPKLEMTGVSKVIAEMYKCLPEKKKLKYTEMAAEQRRIYELKMEQFYRDHPEQVPKPNSSKESKFSRVVTTGPQKPATPFKLFCNDKFRKHKDDANLDKAAFLLKCKEQWRTLSDRKKAEYITRVIEEESKYQEDLKVYKSDNPDFVTPGAKSVLTKEERIIIEKVAGKPEKPPNSGYSLFSRLMLVSNEIKQTPPKERMFKISQLWKDMSEADQNKYKEKVAHLLDQYKLEYATYLESLSEEKKAEELTKNQPKRKAAKPTSVPKPPKKKSESEVVEEEKQLTVSQPNSLYKNEPAQPPVNVCLLYLEYFMKTAVHIPLAQREKKGLQAWHKVPEEEKTKLRKELSERKQQYIKNFEKFLKSLSQDELKEYSRIKASGRVPAELSESETDSDTSASSESGSESSPSSDSSNED